MRLTFDNITTSSGLATIPSPYHLLSFSAYNIFRPRDPAFDDIITPHDYNCAVSPPNALLGSRLGSDSKGATFQIADNTALWEEGLHPYFDLKSFYIKPMDAPMPGTRMNVRGHRAGEEEELKWHVDFPSGYHPPFLVNLEEYSRKKWEKLTRVEITADFGEDRLDWEFCLDDLEVVFHKIGYDEGGGKRKASAGSRGQAVLARGM
ncbi:MAG: hypothetical protein LQ343_002023 [Gyalolechia ehrenbergii]|nr:MAG: hypothetical protein LQ343_002023 [Gyalolechia ehrenbergii]